MEAIIMQIKKQLLNEKVAEIIRYIIIGGLTTAVSFSVFWILCYMVGIETNLSNIISIICAVIFAYITNKIIVFRSKTHGPKELIKEAASFVFARGITIITEIGGVFLLVTVLHNPPMLSKVSVSVIIIILNYIISRFWVFKK